MITGVEHVAIFSEDSASLAAWYQEVLGLEIVRQSSAGTFFLQTPDGFLLEIKQLDDQGTTERIGKERGINHIAFLVNEFEGMVDRLLGAEVTVVSEPMISATGGQTFFFGDPDGNILQLLYRTRPLLE